MNTTLAKSLLALFALVAAGVGYYFWQQQREAPQPAPVEVPEAPLAPAPAPPAEPEIRHPIEQAAPAEPAAAPLPAVDQSDGLAGELLAQDRKSVV